MAKAEWGTKRMCPSCGARFYDMMRSPITCPKCEATVEADVPFKVRRGSAAPEIKALAAAAAAKDIVLDAEDVGPLDDDEAEVDDIDGGDADESGLIEDASDLGEDDDDLGEVMEHLDEDLEDEV